MQKPSERAALSRAFGETVRALRLKAGISQGIDESEDHCVGAQSQRDHPHGLLEDGQLLSRAAIVACAIPRHEVNQVSLNPVFFDVLAHLADRAIVRGGFQRNEPAFARFA
jgi:hypothetical protein